MILYMSNNYGFKKNVLLNDSNLIINNEYKEEIE